IFADAFRGDDRRSRPPFDDPAPKPAAAPSASIRMQIARPAVFGCCKTRLSISWPSGARDVGWNIAPKCVCIYRCGACRPRRIEMDFMRRRLLGRMAGLVVLVALAWGAPQQASAQSQRGDVVVFAAASLKNALDAINAQWQKETGKKAVISYAASPALAKQIEQAAPAQIFISADLDWMDYLAKKNLIKPETRSNLLGNRIVLIAPKDKA